MKYVLITILLCFFISSCGGSSARGGSPERKDTPATPVVVVPAAVADKSLEELRKERDSLKQQITFVEQVIKQKEIDRMVWWATLVGYSSYGLGILLLVLSFFMSSYPLAVPLLRFASLAAGGIGVSSFMFVQMIPYLTLLSVLLVVGILACGVWYWFRDRQSLQRVVAGVEELKEYTPSYKEVLRRHVRGNADKWVTNLRQRPR